jgi:hypothetical protein
MTNPQKTGTLANPSRVLQPSAGSNGPTLAERGLTAAHFTGSELKALREICRDADNDVHARRILADALARAEGGGTSGAEPRPRL